jgi:hypothetical protein
MGNRNHCIGDFQKYHSSSLSKSFYDYPILGVVTRSSLTPKKERPLAEPFYELTDETIQATAVRSEEPC